MVLNDIINQAANATSSAPRPPRSSTSVSNRGSIPASSASVSRRTSRKISLFLSQTGDDDEGPRFKERLAAFGLKMVDVFCVWDCCYAYIRLAEFLSFVIFDPFVDLFITLCIMVNTAFMALDQHDQDPAFYDALKNGNYVSN